MAKKSKIPRISKLEEEAWFQLKIFAKKWGIDMPEREYKFNSNRRWKFDFAWPYYKVAIEVEGGIWNAGAHVRGKHFESDCEKYNDAAIRGWKVIRVTGRMLKQLWLENYTALLIPRRGIGPE